MVEYDWPENWVYPAGFSLELVANARTFRSPYNNSLQTVELPGETWRASVSLDIASAAQGGQREAFFGRLFNQVNRVRLWHFARPVPEGTLRGSPTLAVAGAQGAQQIVLSGLSGGTNMLRNPKAVNLNPPWSRSAVGTVTPDAIVSPDGDTNAEKFAADATSSSHWVGQSVPDLLSNQRVSASAYFRSAEISMARIGFVTKTGTGPVMIYNMSTQTIVSTSQGAGNSGVVFSAEAVGNGWFRLKMENINVLSGVTVPSFRMYLTDAAGANGNPGNGTSGVYIWGPQVELGSRVTELSSGPTLLAGDMLGFGGQLFMVAEDVQNDGTSTQLSVPLVNRLRRSAPVGTPVVWDKPKASFNIAAGGVPVAYRTIITEGLSVEFLEAWQ